MLHAFIDESEHRDHYFILTALIVRDEDLPSLEADLLDLIVEYALTVGTRMDGELHGYDLMQQKCDWKGVPFGITSSIYLKAMGIINRHASALFVETIDRHAHRERGYRYLYDHRKMAIGYLLERVNECAYQHRTEACAYLDDHYTAPEGRKEFVEYKATGTFGYKSSRLTHIKELDFHDSRTMFGLQAADLCCYVYKRTITAANAHPRAVKLNNKLWGAVADIRGAGRQRIWP